MSVLGGGTETRKESECLARSLLQPRQAEEVMYGPPSKLSSSPLSGQVLTRKQLSTLPKPEPLIEDWFDRRTSVVVPGDTGSNKTFAAIGWACSVATGVEWLGHAVKVPPSPVLLVVGEGAFGLDERIRAWEEENGHEVRDLYVFKLPSSIAEPRFWGELQEFCELAGVVFVVLDTFSSLAPGADETNDAAMVVRYMNELAVAIDGTVVLTHHTGWENKGRARGGTQLESDPDGVILFQKDNVHDPETTVTITRKKNKEGPNGLQLQVKRRQSADSCVLVRALENPLVTASARASDVSARERALELVGAQPGEYAVESLAKILKGNIVTARQIVNSLLSDGELVKQPVTRDRKNGRSFTGPGLFLRTEVRTGVLNLRPADWTQVDGG